MECLLPKSTFLKDLTRLTVSDDFGSSSGEGVDQQRFDHCERSEQSFSRGENGEQTKPNFTAQNSEEKCSWFAGPIPCSFLFQSW